jgi:hypothetical protein
MYSSYGITMFIYEKGHSWSKCRSIHAKSTRYSPIPCEAKTSKVGKLGSKHSWACVTFLRYRQSFDQFIQSQQTIIQNVALSPLMDDLHGQVALHFRERLCPLLNNDVTRCGDQMHSVRR